MIESSLVENEVASESKHVAESGFEGPRRFKKPLNRGKNFRRSRSSSMPSKVQDTDWSDETHYQTIEAGVTAKATIELFNDVKDAAAFFKFRVPRNAKAVSFDVAELPCGVSMFGLSGSPLTSVSDASDFNPDEESFIRVSRFDQYAPLESGWYYLVVMIESENADVLGGVEIYELDISVTATVQLARTDAKLVIGEKVSSSLNPQVGCFRTFELEIPEGVKTVRLDLDRANADLDIQVRKDRQIIDSEYASSYSDALEARESLVLRSSEHLGFSGSKWFIDIYATYNEAFTPFDLYVTQGEEAPEPLQVLPKLSSDATPLGNAILSTVQLGTQTGAASGTLVSSDGLILTNYHVITEALQFAKLLKDRSENEIVIAFSSRPGVPPVEYFRGEVTKQSAKDDLALVKITKGYYGQAIPDDYQFPFVKMRLANTEDLGKPIQICGYPMSGSIENSPTFSISRGVLSGFLDDRYLKTDADIASGNSGGAGFDDQWRLIGIPTMTIEDPAGAGPTMGIMMDLRLIPESWGLSIER